MLSSFAVKIDSMSASLEMETSTLAKVENEARVGSSRLAQRIADKRRRTTLIRKQRKFSASKILLAANLVAGLLPTIHSSSEVIKHARLVDWPLDAGNDELRERREPIGRRAVPENFVCHRNGADEYDHVNFPENGLVYPASNYTRQEDGSLFPRVPPICVHKPQVLNAVHPIGFGKRQCKYCSGSSCNVADSWQISGLYSTASSLGGTAAGNGPSDYESQTVMCTFKEPKYLSYLTLVLEYDHQADGTSIQRHLFVEIRVNPDDIIPYYSEEAASFQDKICANIGETHEELRNGSRAAICGIGVRAQRVLLKIDIKKGNNYTHSFKPKYNPSPIFYEVPSNELYETRSTRKSTVRRSDENDLKVITLTLEPTTSFSSVSSTVKEPATSFPSGGWVSTSRRTDSRWNNAKPTPTMSIAPETTSIADQEAKGDAGFTSDDSISWWGLPLFTIGCLFFVSVIIVVEKVYVCYTLTSGIHFLKT